MSAIGRSEIIRIWLERLEETKPLQIGSKLWSVPCTDCQRPQQMLSAGLNEDREPIFSRRYFCNGCEEVFCDDCKYWKEYCFVCAADEMNAQGELCN